MRNNELAADKIGMSNIECILNLAYREEKKHDIANAVKHYETILEFVTTLETNGKTDIPDQLRRFFIAAAQRRAAISASFYPRRKKVIEWLMEAREMAIYLGDIKSQASLELFISQTYWLAFKADEAVQYLNQNCQLIIQLNDEVLNKRFLRLKALSHLNEGRLVEAIETYESATGNIERFDDDFSLFAAFTIALVYVEMGVPQRGIGLCDAIRNQCQRDLNNPMLSFSFLLEGLIHCELRHLIPSRQCFEKALHLSEQENIPAFKVSANVGLACIEHLEGTLTQTSKHFIFIRKMPRSAWFYMPHYYTLYDLVHAVYYRSSSFFKKKNHLDFLDRIDGSRFSPLVRETLQRVRILSNENNTPPTDTIKTLIALEEVIGQRGQTFGLAKLRMELARQFMKIHEREKAEKYARDAWTFLCPFAQDAFPSDLRHLLPGEIFSEEDRLSGLIIELGEALIRPKTIEQLLTSIITAISRMTGAERTALFIKKDGSSTLEIAATRNLLKEEILDNDFKSNLIDVYQIADSSHSQIIEYPSTGTESDTTDRRKAIITPLMLDDKNIGVLYQDSRLFSLDTSSKRIAILSALSSQIALAIDRAKAHDEIEKLNKRLLDENLYYLDEKEEFRPFGEIIGTSTVILEIQRLITKVAPTLSTALIIGETGVGKELVARAIHRASARKNNAFIRVNCSALPDSLIDSELFGHEKGAFTGAFKTKAGRFELAHQGTIFLDEISELSLPTQSRLLRVLQEKEFQRVGGTKTLYSDFRLIAATNKDLKKEVAAGRFREDLFYRLNVYPICVPPLRERKEDIPLLATHFLKLFGSQSNKNYAGIGIAEMKRLLNYDWPGNIRELSNVIERAVISGESIVRFPELGNQSEASPPADRQLNLKEIEELTILEALKKSNGKVGGKNGAAEMLGLERHTLLHRMKKLGIRIECYRSLQRA